MILKKKTCINCAFCIRNQVTWYSFPITASRKEHIEKSLTETQRRSIENADDSFIEKEIRELEAWKHELKQKQDELAQKYPYNLISILQNIQPNLNPFEDKEQKKAEQLGMRDKPNAPDHDYLSCYNEQWSELKDNNIKKDRVTFLTKMKCPFYFHYKKLGKQTLAACEKNRNINQRSHRFWVTSFITIFGAIAAIIAVVINIVIIFKKH